MVSEDGVNYKIVHNNQNIIVKSPVLSKDTKLTLLIILLGNVITHPSINQMFHYGTSPILHGQHKHGTYTHGIHTHGT